MPNTVSSDGSADGGSTSALGSLAPPLPGTFRWDGVHTMRTGDSPTSCCAKICSHKVYGPAPQKGVFLHSACTVWAQRAHSTQ